MTIIESSNGQVDDWEGLNDSLHENTSIISQANIGDERSGVLVQVIQYDKLLGATSIDMTQKMFFMEQKNIKARQIRVYIRNNGFKIEPGAMSYFKGNLSMVSGVNPWNFVMKAITGALTGEKMSKPEYTGTGLLVLEPSFKHFILLELGENETIITDKGMFYCSQTSVNISPIYNSQIAGATLGGEGIFQIAITGPGLVVLESPVPMCEIQRIELKDDMLRVDGNFALLRAGNITFDVKKSGKTFIGSFISGEGLVNTFIGTGEVWIAPTLKIYNAISLATLIDGDVSSIDMNTSSGRIRTKKKNYKSL